MELRFLPILTFLCVALVVSHAAVPPEIYWKDVLPSTAMPKAVRNSLPQPDNMEDNKGTVVTVGKGGVHVNTPGKHGKGGTVVNVGPHKGVGVATGKPGGGHTDVNVGPKGGIGVSTGKPGGGHTSVGVGKGGVGVVTGKPGGDHTSVGVGKGGVGVVTGKPGKGGAHVSVGKGGVIVHAGPHKKPVFVGVRPGPHPFVYTYAASETQARSDPTRALFFLEKDMKPSTKMTLAFTQSTNGATFLPRVEAKSIPFSSDKLEEVLKKFSIDPSSEDAKIMEETIKECESKGIKGEEKFCATSLESMVDYATSTLGKNVRAVSTNTETINNKLEKYTITSVRKVSKDDETAVCHKQDYVYAVFYCHKTKGTSAYMVSLVGEDGSKVNAVAICHKDTSAWNPKHLAFQVLKVTPGSLPICHFLPEDHVVWVHN